MAMHESIRVENGYQSNAFTYYPILIIGAGASGIGMACRLREKYRFDQFRIFDRQSGIGGTWWINRYPGVACDIPAISYSFSFTPNYASTQIYPTGSEFVEYLHRVAEKYQIVDKIQLNTDITELRYVEEDGEWEVSISHLAPGTGDLSWKESQQRMNIHGKESVCLRQEVARAKIVLSCIGILVEPNPWPNSIPGIDTFQGHVIHSARWRGTNVDGKDVVVIGTGSSAAQIVPCLLQPPYNVKSVTQLMRTPPWVMPRLQEPGGKETYAKWAPLVYRYVPFLGKLTRVALYLLAEMIWFALFQRKNTKWRSKMEANLIDRMRSIVPEKYHEIMTPHYPYGCKRRVFDEAWLESMSNPKFHLTTQYLKKVDENTVILGPSHAYPKTDADSSILADETHVHADVIVLANGFEATRWLHPLKVYGRGGKSMHDVWDERGGPQAYMGTALDGFPNFFMTVGPNSANGHAPLITSIENINEYILKMIKSVIRGDVFSVEPKEEAALKWTKELQAEFKKTVFVGCRSWYMDEKGWNSTMYPRSQTDLALRCMFPTYSDWDIIDTPRGRMKHSFRWKTGYGALAVVIISGLWAKMVGVNFLKVIAEVRAMLLTVLNDRAVKVPTE